MTLTQARQDITTEINIGAVANKYHYIAQYVFKRKNKDIIAYEYGSTRDVASNKLIQLLTR